MPSKSIALLSVIALLLPMLLFVFASPPLLVLKHDTPLDGRFIRSVFNTYYVAVILVASIGAASHAVTGQPPAALALAGVAAIALATRGWVIARMDNLRAAIAAGDPTAIPQFRRLHITGMLLNVAQLGIMVWGIPKLAVL